MESKKIWLYSAAILATVVVGNVTVHADNTANTATTTSSTLPKVTSVAKITVPSSAIGTVGTAFDLSKNVTVTDSTGKTLAFSALNVSVSDGAGNPVSLSGTTFTPTAGGDYTAIYSYKDANGVTATATENIRVPISSTPSISAPSAAVGTVGTAVDISKGVSATDSSGKVLPFSALTVDVTDGNNNEIALSGTTFTPKVGGSYDVNYSYTDPVTGVTVSADEVISVPASKLPTLTVASNITANIGQTIDLTQQVSGTDSQGNPIKAANLQISVYPGSDAANPSDSETTFTPTTAGTYDVSYYYTDPVTGDATNASQEIIVPKTAVASISAPSQSIGKLNTAFDLSAGVSATDVNGNAVKFDKISVSVMDANGNDVKVNGTTFTPTTEGLYYITYQLADGTTTALSQVYVPYTSVPSITAPSNAVGKIGQSFDVSTGVSATNEAGNAVDFSKLTVDALDPTGKDITITGNSFVPTIEGNYGIIYNYVDADGNYASATQTLLVPYTKTPAIIVPSDDVIKPGTAYDFSKVVKVYDSNGKEIPLTDSNFYLVVDDANGNGIYNDDNPDNGKAVGVNGPVKFDKAGTYSVLIGYIDPTTGNITSATETIYVTDDVAAVKPATTTVKSDNAVNHVTSAKKVIATANTAKTNKPATKAAAKPVAKTAPKAKITVTPVTYHPTVANTNSIPATSTSNSTNQQLPTTGESSSNLTIIAGAILLLSSLTLTTVKIKRKND